MKLKHRLGNCKKVVIISLMLSGTFLIKAQELRLYGFNENGAMRGMEWSQIQQIRFEKGNVVLESKTGGQIEFSLLKAQNLLLTREFHLGVNSFSTKQVDVYPNPTNDVFIINGKANALSLQVISLSGKVMPLPTSSIVNNAEKTMVNIAALKPGLYTVRYQIDKKWYVQKIVRK